MLTVLDGFKGNWDVVFVARRYFRTFRRNTTTRKLANAVLALGEMLAAVPRVRSRPFVLRLEPTSTCNLRCPRCSTGLGRDRRPKGFLALEDLDFLLEKIRREVVFVRLDGDGEPLLHPGISELIRRIKAAGMGVDLSSHFNNLPVGGIEALVESGLDRIMIAVDGTTQEVYERYRVGGSLNRVLDNVRGLVSARARLGRSNPLVELQFLKWGYNDHQVQEVRQLAPTLGVDRLTVIEPDRPMREELPALPKRCFWLWCVLTVDWQLNYHSCTNAWTYPFPRLNARELPPAEAWNSPPYVQARLYNRSKRSSVIADDGQCLCNHCTDMLVAKRPPGYVCE